MDNNQFPHPERVSYTMHRKDRTWKIIFPAVLVTLIILAACVLLSYLGYQTSEVGRWAEIATIWLVILIMTASLIFLALLLAMVVLMSMLLQRFPRAFGRVQNFYLRINARTVLTVDRLLDPLLTVQSWYGGIRSMGRRKKS